MQKHNLRIVVSEQDIEHTMSAVREALRLRVEEKGPLSTIGSHEALGIITEEYYELIEAIKSNNLSEIAAETLDIIVPAIFFLASLNAYWGEK